MKKIRATCSVCHKRRIVGAWLHSDRSFGMSWKRYPVCRGCFVQLTTKSH